MYRKIILSGLLILGLVPIANAIEMPLLGKSPLINLVNFNILPDFLSFSGGGSVDGLPFQSELNVIEGQAITLKTILTVSSKIAQNPADIFVLAEYNGATFVISHDNDTGAIKLEAWQGITQIKPFMSVESFLSPVEVPIYEGALLKGGVTVYVGYRWDAYVGTSPAINIRVNSQTPTALTGDFIAQLGFLPNPDGFGFENYGDVQATDLNDQDIVDFLGRAQACHLTADGACVLKATAQRQKQEWLEGMTGGHCYGMALASTALFTKKIKPEQYQENITQPIRLLKNSIRKDIARYFVMQSLTNIQALINATKTPNEVLDAVITGMKNGDPIAILTIYNNQKEGGHAITPYAVQDKGNGEVWIYVYDNNYPDDSSRIVKINRDMNTWVYEGATINPSEPASSYFGDAVTKTLGAIPLSAHDNPGIYQLDVAELRLHSKQARMLVTNAAEQRIGFDFTTGVFINEIAGAEFRLSLDDGTPPAYLVPLMAFTPPSNSSDALDQYLQVIQDQSLSVEIGLLETSALATQAPFGFSIKGKEGFAGFENIQLSASEHLYVGVHPSGRFVYIGSNTQLTNLPTVFLTINDDNTQASYEYEISNIQLAQGQEFALLFNEDNSLLVMSVSKDGDNVARLDSSAYSLKMKKVNAEGQAIAQQQQITLPANARSTLRAITWESENTRTRQLSENIGKIEITTISK
ncbi:hypothetical protein [Beggiatoa leptomitoformis]|uniref:Uncharacterized protein n=1 Tax=Beggiatoa leptomitoformis TaxID=288004 RepID=A0A2N9YAZ1_9GAMM|nr:hypothetical protein [Beggiatoa leptomitoformis]ALG66993.1 hypothetical protein AL038_03745 [Beggiatoa leptomitoformis]AUI67636.1 hypothetical protein BLE401_02275 [Beggiatoa leptomitoformis]